MATMPAGSKHHRISKEKFAKRKRCNAEPLGVRDFTAINAALEKHLELTLTERNQKALRRRVGEETFTAIQEIIAFAGNRDAWLEAPGLSAAGDRVAAQLSQHYPWLSQVAIFKVVNQATYGWR